MVIYSRNRTLLPCHFFYHHPSFVAAIISWSSPPRSKAISAITSERAPSSVFVPKCSLPPHSIVVRAPPSLPPLSFTRRGPRRGAETRKGRRRNKERGRRRLKRRGDGTLSFLLLRGPGERKMYSVLSPPLEGELGAGRRPYVRPSLRRRSGSPTT